MRLAVVAGIVAGIVASLGVVRAEPGTAPGNVVRVEHRDPATPPMRGHPGAPVTIEYFFIPQLQAATRLPHYRALERLYARHPARVRIVYRVIKPTNAVQLPAAVLEAQAQGKFSEFMEALHGVTQTQSLTKEHLVELARTAEMDVNRLAAAISDGRYTDSLLANERRMQRLGASPQAIAFNSKTARVTTDADYEREYSHAYDRAQALIDQGYDPRDLPRVFDEQLRRAEPPLVMSSSLTDDGDSDPTQHRLAQPPLRLAGLPSFGRPDATAPLSIVILCRPTDPACVPIMRLVQRLIQDVYADEARGVWAPWFDVTREDARDLALLGDAALCAEQIGTSPDVLSESSGWRWIMRLLDAASRSHGRRVDDEKLEKLILSVAAGLSVDTQRLSACMSRAANRTFELIAELRKSGVRSSPAVVIGGRIYPGLSDEGTIRKLIDAELAPGVLGESSDSQFERLLFFLSSPKGK